MLNVRGWWKWLKPWMILKWLLVAVFLALILMNGLGFSLTTLTKDYPLELTLMTSGLVVLAFADFLRRPEQPLRVPLNVVATILIVAAFCLVLTAIYLFFFPLLHFFNWPAPGSRPLPIQL